jgi:hypothetical protein
VTTGSYGSALPNFLSMGVWSHKVWNGADGKYETYATAFRRLKWNSYTLRAAGLLCTAHRYEMSITYTAVPGGPTLDYSQAPGVDFEPTLGGNQIAVTDDLKQKALTKLLAKIKSHDLNLGVELGQMNQTVRLLAGNLGKLGRAALALKRGDFSTAARQLGTRPRGTRLKPSDVPGRWLELQYGWLPLLSSSFEAAKAFEEISNGPRKTTFVASGTRKVRYEASLSPTNHSCFVNARVGRRLQYEMYEEMSVPRQLGLYDPLSIAWELTPWSFVVDWFYPIGQYLSNLNQIPYLKGRWIVTDFYKIERQTPDFKWVQMQPFGPGWTLSIRSIPKATLVGNQRVRVFSASPPAVPSPKFVFGGINSTRRFWNAVSLAHLRFTR